MPVIATPIPQPAGNYVGRYTSEYLLKTYLGTMNVIIESDTDGTGLENPVAVAQSIKTAEDEADSRMSVLGRYVTPLNFGTNLVDNSLIDNCNKLAAYYLFMKVFFAAMNNTSLSAYESARQDALDWLNSVAYGDIVLSGVAAITTIQAPVFSPGVNSGGTRWISNGMGGWW